MSHTKTGRHITILVRLVAMYKTVCKNKTIIKIIPLNHADSARYRNMVVNL